MKPISPVFKQEDPWLAMADQAAAWGSGQVKAADFNEQKRVANEQLSLERDKLTEQKREWTTDDEFRWRQLHDANMNAKLNAEQQARLARFSSLREEHLRNQGYQFEAGQRQADRNLQDLTNRREVAVQARGQDVQHDLGMRNVQLQADQLDMERAKLNDQGRYYDIADKYLAGRDPTTLKPEERAALEQKIAEEIVGPQRAMGGTNNSPVTEQEWADARGKAASLLNNYNQGRAKYQDDMINMERRAARARATGERGGGGSSSDIGKTSYVETPNKDWNQNQLDAWASATGGHPQDFSNLGPADRVTGASAQAMILEAHSKAMEQPANSQAVYRDYEQRIEALTENMPEDARAYLKSSLYNATIVAASNAGDQ